MNEVKISNSSINIPGIIAFVLFIAVVCAGIVYYYRGTTQQLESELGNVERLNTELASETRELQRGLTDHRDGIASVTSTIGKSKKRIKRVYTSIEKSTKSTDKAIKIIEECEKIIKAIKAQK